MITKFDNYKKAQFTKEFEIEYDELVQQCETVFGDIEDGIFEVDWYINSLMNLYYNGGEIYRIVTLRNVQSLNKEALGNHWVMDEGLFGRVYGNINQEHLNMMGDDEDSGDYDWKPYVVTANINPKSVNVNRSIHAFKELPEEGEIYIENGIPEFVSIKEYER